MEILKKIQRYFITFLLTFLVGMPIVFATLPLTSLAQQSSATNTGSFNVNKYLKADGQENSYLDPNKKSPVASVIIQAINLLVLTIGSVSFLAVVIGGFTYLVSHGNENLVNKAKEIITYAIIGLVIALSAYFIVAFFQNIFYEV